jgi:polysaccharide biosynthesis protein PslH
MNILMLSSTFPYPPSRGGTEIRTFNLLKYLYQSHKVTLATQLHAGVSEADVAELRQYVNDLVLFPLPADPRLGVGVFSIGGKTMRFLESLIKGTPPNVLHRYSPAMQSWVDAQVRWHRFDVVTCEHSVNEIYIRPEFRSQVRTVVDVHSSVYGWTRQQLEIEAASLAQNSLRDQWQSNRLRDRLYLPILARYEKRYCAKFSRIVVTTEDDRQELLRLRPEAQIDVIPNGVDLQLFPYRSYDPNGHDLVFVGAMDASHNIDAARFFALDVMPLLRQHYPQAVFRIVGARPAAEVLALAEYPGIVVEGQVPSIANFLHRATVCVVPLRTGFGIKNKTLEAMAAGVPVVGSDRGLEGLAVDGDHTPLRALRANHIEDYIQAIDRLYCDPELRMQLSQQGRSLVEQTYTWEQAGQSYEQVLLQSSPAQCFSTQDAE